MEYKGNSTAGADHQCLGFIPPYYLVPPDYLFFEIGGSDKTPGHSGSPRCWSCVSQPPYQVGVPDWSQVFELDFLLRDMERERRGAPVLYIVLVKRAVRKARGNVSVRNQADDFLSTWRNCLCCFCGKADLHVLNPLRHCHCSLRMPGRTWSCARSFCFIILCTWSESPWGMVDC